MNKKPAILETYNIDEDSTDRQKRVTGWSQGKIAECKVLVAGAGALGNELTKNLVQLGVGRIYLVDFDYVVTSNLNRCIFLRSQDSETGESKAVAVAKRAKDVNPGVEITPLVENLEKVDKRIYQNVDIAFSGLDNLAARIQLNIDCCLNNIPLVDGGTEGFMGYVQVVIPPDTPCLECGMSERDWKHIWQRLSCTGPYEDVGERVIPALPTTTSIVAGIQVQEAIKIIFGLENYRKKKKWNDSFGVPLAGKRLFYNAVTNTYKIYELSRNKKCNICAFQ